MTPARKTGNRPRTPDRHTRLRLRLRRLRREAGEEGFLWGESLIRGMVDLFLLTLLFIVAQQPELGLGSVKVIEPVVPEEERKIPPTQPLNRNDRLLLRTDGTLLLNNEPVDRATVVARLAALESNKTVSLVIETNDTRTGAVRDFLELQIACSKAGVWQRVEILYRPQAAPTGGSNQ